MDELLARAKFERFLSRKLAGRTATKKETDSATLAYEQLHIWLARLTRAHRLVKAWSHSWKKLTYTSARKTPTDVLARGLEGAIPPGFFLRSVNFVWVKPFIEA